jgi:hypothetical protein
VIAWIACLFFIVAKGALTPLMVPGYFDVDLVAVLVAYMVARHGDSRAGGFALGMGLFTDVLSAAPLGLFSLLNLVLFLGIRLGDAFVDVGSIKGQLIIVSLAVVLKKFMFIGLLNLFSLRAAVDARILSVFLFSAVFTAMLSPAVSLGLDALGKAIGSTPPESEESQP